MRETAIESYLVKGVEMLGGDCQKHVSPGRSGVVDRIAILPYLPVWWIECKRPDCAKVAALQRHEADKLRKLGQKYALLDTKTAVDNWLVERAFEMRIARSRA
jgi:hypothetical protein